MQPILFDSLEHPRDANPPAGYRFRGNRVPWVHALMRRVRMYLGTHDPLHEVLTYLRGLGQQPRIMQTEIGQLRQRSHGPSRMRMQEVLLSEVLDDRVNLRGIARCPVALGRVA